MIAPLSVNEQRRIDVRARSLLWGPASLLPDDQQLSDDEIRHLLFVEWLVAARGWGGD